jgi:type IX secretion system PorP/SprF family membrane protein
MLTFISKAQQIPITSQPLSNAYLYNPAAAGVQGYIDITLGGRQQWTGIENAPRTYYLYANSALGKNSGKDFSYLSLPVSNPGYYNQLAQSKPKVKHAIGGRVFADSYGAFSESGIGVDYAIHLPLKEKLYLSFGLGLQASNFYFDRSKAQVLDAFDPSYDQFLSGKESELLFNGRFGAYIYTDKLRIGYSINQLVQNSLTGETSASAYQGQKIHQFGNVSYRFDLNKIGLTPSAAILFAPHSPLSIYGGLIFDYNRLFLISAAYRNDESIVFGIGFTALKIFRLSYTYDFPMGDVQKVSSGSHELLLKVMLNRKNASDE